MTKVLTIVAETERKARQLLRAKLGNRRHTIRIACKHDNFNYISSRNIQGGDGCAGPETEFRADSVIRELPVYIIVAIYG
jgi:hypothetical protein